MLNQTRYRADCLIAFAFVATHNQFVLDRGGKVFNPHGAGDQVAGWGDGGRSPGAARGTQLVDGLLLAKAEQSRQGCRGAEAAGADEPWERRLRVHRDDVGGLSVAGSSAVGAGAILDRLAQRLNEATPQAVVGQARTLPDNAR